MVVTDMTEARRNEEMLRALTHRVVQAQEAERGRVALELHDNITQLLCAVLVRSQALADKLSARDGPSKREAMKLREMLGQTAEEVERISRNLRPSVLDAAGSGRRPARHQRGVRGADGRVSQAGLRAVDRAAARRHRVGALPHSPGSLEKRGEARPRPPRHGAPEAAGRLRQLAIKDDGIGFDPDHHPARRKGKGGLGLLSMRERATYVGGTLKIKSARRAPARKSRCAFPSPRGREGPDELAETETDL